MKKLIKELDLKTEGFIEDVFIVLQDKLNEVIKELNKLKK